MACSAGFRHKSIAHMTDSVSGRDESAGALALVVASNEPLLYLREDHTLIAASESFCRAFSLDPAFVAGTTLATLGDGEWAIPRLRSLLNATAAGGPVIVDYELDLVRRSGETRHLKLNPRRLVDPASGQVRLLLAVTDVTAARAEGRQKDELIRENAILMQEVQHRVANSLQIIASVLMQSARRVQSEEARGYLQSAHHRVLSIAAVQKQLSMTRGDRVALRPYLAQLCDSLGASMIADPERLKIVLTADDSVVDPDVSVSLGLIVTELVINALKHAFPDQAPGAIAIDFRTGSDGWALSVSDNGVGMPTGKNAPKGGLGTGIVEALARNLNCSILIGAADPHIGRPGTMVTVRQRPPKATDTQTNPAV